MRSLLFTFAVALSVATVASRHDTNATTTVPTPSAQTTTLSDQADLSVTVYNSDIALVRDVRNLKLPTCT